MGEYELKKKVKLLYANRNTYMTTNAPFCCWIYIYKSMQIDSHMCHNIQFMVLGLNCNIV